jgi:hyperosmotically inducible protein
MNIVPSRIVIGVGLAIVGAGLVTYALHPSSTPAPIARIAPIAPPPPVVQEAPPPAAPAPETPAVAAPTPAAPPAVAQTDNGTANANNSDATPAAPEPKANRHSKAHRSAATDDSVAATAPAAPAAAPTGATPDAAANTGGNTVAQNGDSVKPADESAAPAVPAAPAAASAEGAPAVDVANADSKITTEVKSRLAADSVTKDADLSVNTTQGVVVVTGTVATQDAVDHVKLVAQNVPDVKSVDTSALKVSG